MLRAGDSLENKISVAVHLYLTTNIFTVVILLWLYVYVHFTAHTVYFGRILISLTVLYYCVDGGHLIVSLSRLQTGENPSYEYEGGF